MFLTTVNLAKAKSKTILVQMMSAAGTGYCFNTKRNRLRDKMVLRKHDPIAPTISVISASWLYLIWMPFVFYSLWTSKHTSDGIFFKQL